MRLKWVGLFVVAVGTFFAGGWLLRRGLATMGSGEAAAGSSAPSMSPTRLFSAVLETVRGYAVDSLDESGVYRLSSGLPDIAIRPLAQGGDQAGRAPRYRVP